jgi:hypothetical protein
MRQKFQHSRKLTQAVWKEVTLPFFHLFFFFLFFSFFFPLNERHRSQHHQSHPFDESDGVRLKEKKRKKKGRKKRDGKKVMLGCGWMAQ